MNTHKDKGVNTTCSNSKSDNLTLDDVMEAVSKMPKPQKILDRIVLCRKHWKQLDKFTEVRKSNSDAWGNLLGIEVVIKPYLKKVRLYYKYL